MDPAARRDLILDGATRLILEKGIVACTPEAVANAADVSKALVYRYFQNVDGLLNQLLEREFDIIRGRNRQPLPPETSIDDVLRIQIRRYLEYLVERGDLLRALLSHADMMGSNKAVVERSRKAIMAYWIQQLITAYDLPPELARMGVIMTTAALDGAQGTLRRGNVSLDDAADFWTTFVRAGWRAVAKAE